MIEVSKTRHFYCQVCGHVYDEAVGSPESGIAPGTLWEQVPADWCCPECGVPKADYIEATF